MSDSLLSGHIEIKKKNWYIYLDNKWVFVSSRESISQEDIDRVLKKGDKVLKEE